MPSPARPAPRWSAAAVLALALALAACATQPTRMIGLSSVDESALAACREPIQAKTCGGAPDAAACWNDVVARYGALSEDSARKRFLVDAGCPSPTVESWLPDVR